MLSQLSNMSETVNGPILYVTLVSLFFIVGITAVMLFFVFKYNRKRSPVGVDIHGHDTLEIVWSIIPLILAVSMFWYGWVGYKFMREVPEDAMIVQANARMWSWSHTYENGVQSAVLNIPVEKAVKVDLVSADVLHSYFIPAFKVKQDVVPGVPTYLWFSANQVGEYDIFCAEYCGLNHSQMLGKVNVMEQAEFDAWYAAEGEKAAENAKVLEAAQESGDDSALASVGKQLASTKGCIACHSTDGSPLIGPTYKGLFGKTETVVTDGTERKVLVDEDYLHKSIMDPLADIVKGFQPLMPPQASMLTEADAKALIAYIKTIQ